MTQPDHLVIGTHHLEQGKVWLERFLGVSLGEVNQHAKMGTHNRLLSLGAHCYLELIAIDPAAERPAAPRWFGLDTQDALERIAQKPRLLGWVASSDDIEALHEKTGGILGSIHAMSRGTKDATFSWKITIPDDGYPLEGGLIPHLIQWVGDRHPCQVLPDQVCRFEWMEAAHPHPAKVNYLLGQLGLEGAMKLTASPPYSGMSLCAYLSTPKGPRVLMS